MLTAMLALTTILVGSFAYAQDLDCKTGRDLLTIPEIKSLENEKKLQGVIILSDERRTLARSAAGTACASTPMRFFKGFSVAEPNKPWPSTGDPLPGPTLRARVGDVIQLAFLNQINTRNFANTLDQGEEGKPTADPNGCDAATATTKGNQPSPAKIYPRNDKYPNCLHGSTTANLHFHGTHTTPSTTGDNVLLFIRPALRDGGKIEPDDNFVTQQFGEIFKWCDANGAPQKWEQLPEPWRTKQMELLQKYDTTAPYGGVAGKPGAPALPPGMQLWPKNAARLAQGLWPQYSIGAFPHCFPLPAFDPTKVKMGQAPGTHWYHAHKHGSTALNVGNGMVGAFVIEGAYDAELRKFYEKTPQHRNWGLQEQVLVIQQVESTLNLLSPGMGVRPPPVSVNGRLSPVVTMRPNQVQLWRVINTSARNFVQFDSFSTRGRGASPAWRQIAQDGVQFAFENYQRLGTLNNKFNLAAANRADLLVRAPALEADYQLQVVLSISDLPAGTPTTLLTVRVKAEDKKIDPPMDFITNAADFPKLPPFLADITDTEPTYARKLTFNTNPVSGRNKVPPDKDGNAQMPLHEINGELFDDHYVNQTMTLNTVEEWTVANRTLNIAHPFHIHINPFQIVEVFQPNSAAAKDPTNKDCFADPMNPATWKPCQKLPQPYVWWDVFAIPTARQNALATTVCTELDKCPANIRPYTACAGGTCTVTIPGYFKFRSRFVDFTGQYVLHCHILAHEDRGMMQLVQVVPKAPNRYEHH